MGECIKIRRATIEPAGAELLADIIVGVATTSVDITGLNIGKDDELLLVSDVANSSGDMYLYANNNLTNSNYWCQALVANGTTVAGYRYNLPYMRVTAGNFFHSIKIKLTNSGYFVTQNESINLQGTSAIRLDNTYTTSTFTTTSITSLKITASVANQIGIGSRFQLYRLGGA